ncbi:MAG TPA: CAP domain-containing protein, partial [Polyangia bacterium]|nr:CAP domain-containing protein [Polyangia bacterium]
MPTDDPAQKQRMKERPMTSGTTVRRLVLGAALAAASGCGAVGSTGGSGGQNQMGASGGVTGAGGDGDTGGAVGSGGAGGAVSASGGAVSASGGASGTPGGQVGSAGGSSAGGATGAGGAAPSAVCDRWKADRADLSEGTWTGSVVACDPGDLTGVGRANALRQVNLFRFLAGLPAVTEDATKSVNAQACALMQDANKTLSHTPPTTWTCYTAAGATAAGQSNIATTKGVRAVGLYMNDRGNETTIGHRRWLLSNSLGPIGLGSTSGYSCLMTIGGTGKAGKAFAAWPPPGDVPLAALTVEGSIDTVGWSIQSDTIDLSAAQVAVTDAGTARPVTVMQLPANYGSKY